MDSGDNRSKSAPANQNSYLWDKSGEPDGEMQKLESLLGQFRYDRPTPALPQIAEERRWAFLPHIRFFPALAAATAAGIIVGGAVFMISSREPTSVTGEGWQVSRVAGAPEIGRKTIRSDQPSSFLGVGQVLETDDHSRASLEASSVGMIDIDPGTRLRLLKMSKGAQQIALDHGTIHAHIWAPPGEFVVGTPSAVTVDLGCAYTLQVDDSGAGLVRTSLGWVGFTLNGRESFIPAGAACVTKPTVGPGTPYFEDASPEFRAALARLDFEDKTPDQRTADLAMVLAQSRTLDALTLWHLLSRVDSEQRIRVYDRLQKLAPAPAGVTRDGILRLDQPMLDSWWNSLGFDDISIWRHWEHSWSGRSAADSKAPSNPGAQTPAALSAATNSAK
jgi:FecR protein